jgi:hypothetical protein
MKLLRLMNSGGGTMSTIGEINDDLLAFIKGEVAATA